MEVKLDHHYKTKVYTSGSKISGHVEVNTTRDTPFDTVDIICVGASAVRLDFVQSFTTSSSRTFMKLSMPIPDSDLPSPRVFEAGKTYNIPFKFIVPHALTLGACTHDCTSPNVKDQHLRLPPSVGCWEGDDQAPDMTYVEYSVKCRATWTPPRATERESLVETKKVIKILPAFPEDAPLDITFRDERYNLSKQKTIRKNLFAAKAGKLNVSAGQPGAIMLKADGHGASMSNVKVNLEFSPASLDAAPPKVNSVSGKLLTTTFFGGSAAESLPNLGARASQTTNPCLTYSTTNSLFTKSISKLSWGQKHPSLLRRDSGYSSNYVDEESAESADDAAGKKKKQQQGPPIRHVASIDVPFSVPSTNKKIFLPTFHSCLISRTYVLQLTVSVGPTNTTMTLNLPLQIGVEQHYQQSTEEDELPSFEAAVRSRRTPDEVQLEDSEDTESYFRPRVLRLPSEELMGTSTLRGHDAGRLQPIGAC